MVYPPADASSLALQARLPQGAKEAREALVAFCFEDEALLSRMLKALNANGLKCSCIAFPEYAGEFDTVLGRAKDAGAVHINI